MEVLEPTKADQEAASLAMWEYATAFAPMAVVKCAIELRIAEVLESHGGAMTHAELSAALGRSPSILHRIMRYLIHCGIFEKKKLLTTGHEDPSPPFHYVQTPLSKLLMRDGQRNSMAALILLESSPVMLAPWHRLSFRALTDEASAFGATHGKDLWEFGSANPDHSKLFNDAMACHARSEMRAIVEHYPDAFNGIGSVVDVGGGDGTAMSILVEACPWIRGINFDLPHVVSMAPRRDGVEHVGGDMFDIIPKADAAFVMVCISNSIDNNLYSQTKHNMLSLTTDNF